LRANQRCWCSERSSCDDITGDSVSATTPEMNTAPASVNANSRNSAPVSPPWMPIGAYTAASVMVMAMIGADQLARADSAAWYGRPPSRMWRSTFSTTTMASSTDQADRQHDRQQRQQVQVKPETCIKKHRADQRHRDATDPGTSADRTTEKKEDHDHHDQESSRLSVWATSRIVSSM
jgi:hypothetical protein